MTIGRPTTLPEPWRALALALGGVSALAAACGVHRETIARWGAGGPRPGAVMVAHVNGLARRRKLEEPWG